MPGEIVLLSGEAEAPHLAESLQRHQPDLSVVVARSREQLEEACLAPPPEAGSRRLIAYCTSVIVPPSVIEALPGPAYNFHPGPPTYPGSHAASFAIYDGAARFGVTAHVMEERVDAGPLVQVAWLDVPDGIKFMELEMMAYQAMFTLFNELAPHLAADDAPLPIIDTQWSGRKTTERDFQAMRELAPDMSEDEIRLRYRAFG